MRFGDLVQETTVQLNLRHKSKEAVIQALVKHAAQAHDLDESIVLRGVLEREQALSTGVGQGVAVPHTTIPGLLKPVVVLGRTKAGIDFDSIDGAPVRLIFLLLTPEGDIPLHLKLLSRVSRLCQQPALRDAMINADTPKSVLDAIHKAEHSYLDL